MWSDGYVNKFVAITSQYTHTQNNQVVHFKYIKQKRVHYLKHGLSNKYTLLNIKSEIF